jgi:hypothetical protein
LAQEQAVVVVTAAVAVQVAIKLLLDFLSQVHLL